MLTTKNTDTYACKPRQIETRVSQLNLDVLYILHCGSLHFQYLVFYIFILLTINCAYKGTSLLLKVCVFVNAQNDLPVCKQISIYVCILIRKV